MSLLAATKMVLTLACDESAHLLSDSLDRPLTRVERLAVRLHLLICRNCRRFRRQIVFIRTAIRHASGSRVTEKEVTQTPLSEASLSSAARHRIAAALRHG